MAWVKPAYLEESRVPTAVDEYGNPAPRALRESEGLYAIPSRGRLNQPAPHSTKTAFERKRQAQLRFHAEETDKDYPKGRRIVRTAMNESNGVTGALFDDGRAASRAPERLTWTSDAATTAGRGKDHWDKHLDSSATQAAFVWDDRARPAPRPRHESRKVPDDFAGRRGRGERYLKEMLSGRGAAEGTGFYKDVPRHYGSDVVELKSSSKLGEVISTAKGPQMAAHRGRGERFVREALAGTGAAMETGQYAGVAEHYMAAGRGEGSESKTAADSSSSLSTPGTAPVAKWDRFEQVSRSAHTSKRRYFERELVGNGAARELPGPALSQATSSPSGPRPAVAYPRDLSVRDVEAASKGQARSHWETEAACLMGGHRSGWRDPVAGALPHRTGRQASLRAQAERTKPTALW